MEQRSKMWFHYACKLPAHSSYIDYVVIMHIMQNYTKLILTYKQFNKHNYMLNKCYQNALDLRKHL